MILKLIIKNSSAKQMIQKFLG